MKTAFGILLLIIMIPLIFFFLLGKKPSQVEALGLIDNQLNSNQLMEGIGAAEAALIHYWRL